MDPFIFLSFKPQLIHKIRFLVILMLFGNIKIRLNEHTHVRLGGIGLISGRPTETEDKEDSPPPVVSSEADEEGANVEDDKEPVGIYDHMDLKEVIEKCPEAVGCPASIKYFLVCGSDGTVYQNIGVLACAQRCNKAMKLTNFGPCEGAKPLPRSTLPPLPATTLVNSFGVEVNPEGQQEFDKAKDKDLIDLLKRRIRARAGHFTLPPEWKEWCNEKENKNKCHYGFDPGYNPALYLIPVQPYSEQELWQKYHDNMVRRQMHRLSNGFAEPTTDTYGPSWLKLKDD